MNCSETPPRNSGTRPNHAGRPGTPLAFGALPGARGITFRVPAIPGSPLTLVLLDGDAQGSHALRESTPGVFECVVEQARPGNRYRYRFGSGDERPDPASRFQPDGVHGASEIVDPTAYAWTDANWTGVSARDLVIYELHVGTFTPDGTFAAAAARLEALREVGITAVELMPLADFAGSRNWGYDGVALYAPSRAYGRPHDLRRFVDHAHALGLAVILDVVYNHLGPEGAYLPEFYPRYYTDRHHTPWGRAVNLDDEGSELVRHFILDNARHWIEEYHADGLRLDATHALVEDADGSTVREITRAVRQATPRPIVVHAEDHRNLAPMIEDEEAGGWGLDGVWADDFHHVVRRLLAGDEHGYYADFSGTADELARTIRQGWLYTGQPSPHQGAPRGTDPARVPMSRFVVCLQNHDQIGNRAMGDRLHHGVAPEAWRAATALLLTVPMTPLLFMGQEWGASTPFQYFTDLEPGVGRLVTEGRRREFAAFPNFADEATRDRIPDPQSAGTHAASRLRWEERREPGHAAVLALYTDLLALRRRHPALGADEGLAGDAEAPDNGSVVVRRAHGGEAFWIVVRLAGAGETDLAPLAQARGDHGGAWTVVLTTEDPRYSLDPAPVSITTDAGAPRVRFERPGAVIFRRG